jgi:Dolichyl-phosphate-mannose-protein mannosyltransferase
LDQAPKIRDALGVAPDCTASPARRFYIALLMFAVVLLAILRSAVATRLDSFTIDENYHITAGVSYLRTGDYRINPEHPPLVKLWVAAFMPESVLHLGPLQVFNDKGGERNFTADTVFLKNDPDHIQRHARLAMYCFNGLLLFIFALVARRVFGSVVALGALAFLVIDPTVAAHMPVVMTDLPVTLLGATAVLLSWLAFETWKPAHLAASAIALGLTLATKHSGIIFAEVISAAGLYMALRPSPAVTNNPQASPSRPRRLLAVVVLLLGSCVVLWSTYRFRYHESVTAKEAFNQHLADKIADLQSPRHRLLVSTLAKFHLFPRAYLWGFADIIRAGVEGRGDHLYFMNRMYYEEHYPFHFFPVQLLIKLPLGLLILFAAGLVLFLARKGKHGDRAPFWFALFFSGVFLLTLMTSHSFYAGVRHALPLYPFLAIFASLAVASSLESKSYVLRTLVAVSVVWAIISAVPVLRPWEYHNALAGGTSRAYLHFSDEGIDLGLRNKELASYYHRVLEPKGELPYYIDYLTSPEELRARGVHTIGEKWKSGELPDDSDTLTGTLIVEAIVLTPDKSFGLESLQKIEPSERFGNLLIFRGSFNLPIAHANRFYWRAWIVCTIPNVVLRRRSFSSNARPISIPTFIRSG